jgi:hypothetical protein
MSIIENSFDQSNQVQKEGFGSMSLKEKLQNLKTQELGVTNIEKQADEELAILVGKGEKKAVTPSQSISYRMAKSQLTKATNDSQKVKSMIVSNIHGQLTSSQQLKIAKNQRVLQGLAKINQNPQNHPHLFQKIPITFGAEDDKFLSSLTTVISGPNWSNDSNSEIVLHDAKYSFMKYILTIMAQKDKYMSSRLYSAYHFNDSTIFTQFPTLEKEMLLAYNRFVSIVNKS